MLILKALHNKGIPIYLKKLVASYLSTHSYFFCRGDGERITRLVSCGIPQGSVLGPFLWNLTYDVVLQTKLPFEAKIIGYTDDTIIVVSGNNVNELKAKAEYLFIHISTILDSLGLTVASNKMEVMVFNGKRRSPIFPNVICRGTVISPSQYMRYLGIIIGPKRLFKEHLTRVVQKAEKVLFNLYKLMPNIRGPRETKRRLFASVVRSVLLYGAPIWAREDVLRHRGRILPLIRIQRRLDQRIICAYRTISGVAAGIIARSPPIDLLAASYNERYDRLVGLRHVGEGDRIQRFVPIASSTKEVIKAEAH